MLKVLCLLITLKLITCNNTVDYYVDLIQSETDKATFYQLPKDANEFKPTQPGIKDFGSYDFVVIGAGSTGAVIANRLSEVKEWTVLLLEPGKYPTDYIEIAGIPFENLFNSDYNWGYESIPQTTACLGMVNKICPYPRGKGVGGSSLINGLISYRGAPIDFDKWAGLGNAGWSFKDVLPYFKKLEDFHKNDPLAPVDYDYHGTGGPVYIEYPLPRSLVTDAFFGANEELGYKLVDNNGPKVIGTTPAQRTIKHGRRQDTGTVFINPILKRKNLRVLSGAYATKINIQSKVARSVRFTYRNQTYSVCATKEIILSAGVFGSPQILLWSGVGPKNHLEEVGIPVIEDLEVGSKYYDHPLFGGLIFSTNATAPEKTLRQLVQDYLNGRGSLTKPNYVECTGLYQTTFENTPNYPDIELIVLPPSVHVNTSRPALPWSKGALEVISKDVDPRKTFTIDLVLLGSKSQGSVRLKSKNPFDYPVIDARLLSDEKNHDIDAMYQGIQLVLKMAETSAFKKINAKLLTKPLPQCKRHKFGSKAYWYCTLRVLTVNIYHPVGSCPMGNDTNNGDVVDSKHRVHGIKNLRVADASVFPLPSSGNPGVPCMMIGEKFADTIKAHYDL